MTPDPAAFYPTTGHEMAPMGGNAGAQTLAVAVRALATRDLAASNMWRVVLREALFGLANGFIFAALIEALGYVWFEGAILGGVLAAAMIGNLFVAALAGILAPITLERIGAAPALGSGTLITTVIDNTGFYLFLGPGGVFLL